MADLRNIAIYQSAKAGQRVFSVANAKVAAVKIGLWRMGYKVRLHKGNKVTTITIQEK